MRCADPVLITQRRGAVWLWGLALGAALTAVVATTSLAEGQSRAQAPGTGTALSDEYLRLPDPEAPYPLATNGLDLREALKLYGKNLRVGIVMTDGVVGTVPENWPAPDTRLAYLEALSLEFDFVWFFDGRSLRISEIGAMETAVLPLQNNDGAAVLRILQELDIYQNKFTHRSDLRNRSFLVSGPVDYVEMVRKAVEAIEAADRNKVTILRGAEGNKPAAVAAIEAVNEPQPPVAATGPRP